MIVDAFLFFLSAWIFLLGTALQAISLLIPPQFTDTIVYFLGRLNYLNGFINIPDIMTAFGWFLFFLTSYATMKLILKTIEWLPWIGSKLNTKIF